MKFGNASWGFREAPLEEQLKVTKELGLEVLELGIANAPKDLPLDACDETLAEVKALYEKYGIELCCAATGDDFTNGDKNDVAKIKKVTDICAKLGIKYLRIFAGFSPVAEVTGKRWDNMIECLKEVDGYAASKGVFMVVETHGGVNGYDDGVEHFLSTSSDPETLYKMMSQLPETVKVNFDPANLWAVGVKHPEEVYNKLKPRVAVVHLKDFADLPSGHLKPAACGESSMDWKEILKSLADFDGPALFEYENVEDVAEGSKRCYDYIKSLLK
ncbi:MAG: sugar phosphate isomerase/epimerase [Clostridiales bacterium]|nr:sugar phosphate isomerase/epimerase [Clostridiales bacterium]